MRCATTRDCIHFGKIFQVKETKFVLIVISRYVFPETTMVRPLIFF